MQGEGQWPLDTLSARPYSENREFLKMKSRQFRFSAVALCIGLAMLCASCATGARDGSEKKSPKEIAQLYVELGTAALLRNDFSLAVEDLRKALTADSTNAVARNHLGLAYYALGQKSLAREEIARSLVDDPKYSDAYINLGNFAAEEGDKRMAKHYLNKALENLEYRYRHRVLTNLAGVAISENNTLEAKRFLYQSLQINPDYCLSHFLLGTLLMREDRPAAAAQEFTMSVAKTCAGNPEGHLQLGLAHLKTRNFAKARTELVYLVEQFPQSLQAQKAGDYLKDIP